MQNSYIRTDEHKAIARRNALNNPAFYGISYWTGKKRGSMPEETKEKLRNANTKKDPLIINCLYCNKEKRTYPSRIKIGWGKYCSNKCLNNSKIGQPAPNKGKKRTIISTKPSDDYRMRRLFKARMQKQIFERDDYTCQICFIKGNVLHIDHIQSWAKYIDLRFDANNCRTLCRKCHYQVTFGKQIPKDSIWGLTFMKGGN